ncbi:phosphatase PAP2 family protein [Pseudoxanthomonas dokdonensis]|uniref:Inositolphosphotransferase Aur1/Ipt1 domain-containing protein n=1 Tax=Pseudoxanthomonas dokdonensis TaxID=344882 RepID=A0A0R0CUZ7_9GAMM|nr:phosphatase PAP2 family protein [Pseudoxanthomonas dokdonensis]KRG69774.1 hypothetical protein ABB29_08195 [Pseudoxanthomonas dokdonensis]
MAATAIDAPVRLRVRVLAVSAVVVFNTALYLWVNAHPLRTPTMLPVTALDSWFGWHAWTIWPYWLLLLINPFLAVCIRERRLLLATFRAYVVAMAINLLVWLAWPTQLPRHPLPDTLDPLTTSAWQLLLALDEPDTCFPSGHITIPTVVMFAFAAQYPAARRWIWLVLLLFPSIITTGQHYAVDLLGGMLTAIAGIALAGHPLWRAWRRPSFAG